MENIKQTNNFTLQAIQNHKFSHVLEDVGQKDISSLVNFNDFFKIAKKYNLKIEEYSTQKEFLIKFGILERKKKFLESKYAEKIDIGVNRIINDNMGNLFKCLIVSNLK